MKAKVFPTFLLDEKVKLMSLLLMMLMIKDENYDDDDMGR